jgi:transcription initiation factor TFIID TATA-box-binding protein
MTKAGVVNVVATATLNQKLNLDEIAKFKGILRDPNIYGGRVAYFKCSNMRGKVSIFASGKMISTGTISEEQARRELEYAKEFLVKRGFVKSTALQCEIQNIVVTADFEGSLDLEILVKKHKMVYEPEQFPGAILKIKEPGIVTVLVFASGKAVITGLKSFGHIMPVIQKLENIIKTS